MEDFSRSYVSACVDIFVSAYARARIRVCVCVRGWVARLRGGRSPGWCSRWNTRDGGGPTLLGGVKEVGGVVATPARQLLLPASPKARCAPRDLFDPIFANQPRLVLLLGSLYRRPKIFLRADVCLPGFFYPMIVDFIEIQRSTRARADRREADSWTEAAVGNHEVHLTEHTRLRNEKAACRSGFCSAHFRARKPVFSSDSDLCAVPGSVSCAELTAARPADTLLSPRSDFRCPAAVTPSPCRRAKATEGRHGDAGGWCARQS